MSLWLVPADGEPIRVEKAPSAVGRDPRADVVLTHPSVSRKHAVLDQTAHGWMVADQNSGNGTWIDGQRVIRALLRPGQSVRFGAVTFTVSLEAPKTSLPERVQPHRPAAPAYAPPAPQPAPPRPAAAARPAPPAPPPSGTAPPTPGGVMSPAEAAEIMGLAPGAPADEVRRCYQRIYNDLQIRLTNAPTAALKRMYQKNLQNLRIAAEVLAPGALGAS